MIGLKETKIPIAEGKWSLPVFGTQSIEQIDKENIQVIFRDLSDPSVLVIPEKAQEVFNRFLDTFGGITRRWRVYGEDGHRQRESFRPSMWYNFSIPGDVRLIQVLNCDVTGTNDYTEVAITRNTIELCDEEMEGQICDGIFENCRVGKVIEVID